ncbi:hypothetical protein [Isoptericola aurantiacus]|uniref:hypothetical protein n=1 Tax=Isoptericola aurantiacus TaxID=3377839 RepID=UPI00383B8013
MTTSDPGCPRRTGDDGVFLDVDGALLSGAEEIDRRRRPAVPPGLPAPAPRSRTERAVPELLA